MIETKFKKSEVGLIPEDWEYRIYPPAHPQHQAYLQTLREALKADCKRLSLIAERLEADAQLYTSDMVVVSPCSRNGLKKHSFFIPAGL